MPPQVTSCENATVYSEIALTMSGRETTSAILALDEKLPISGNDATKVSRDANMKSGERFATPSDVVLPSHIGANKLDLHARGANRDAIPNSNEVFPQLPFEATRPFDDMTGLATTDERVRTRTSCDSDASFSDFATSSDDRMLNSCTAPSVVLSSNCHDLPVKYVERRCDSQHMAQWMRPVATAIMTTTNTVPAGLPE